MLGFVGRQSNTANRALRFGGVDQYMQLGALGLTTTGSISFWINPATTVSASDLRILSQTTGAVTQVGAIALSNGANPGALLMWNGTAWLALTSSAAICAQTWQHVLITVNGTNTLCYVNGVLQNSVAISSWGYGSGTNASLGAKYLLTSGAYFQGKLDDISLWSTALSGSDAVMLYNNGLVYDASRLSAYAASCLRYYKIAQNDMASTLIDAKGTANATLIGSFTGNDFVTDTPDTPEGLNPRFVPGLQIWLDGADPKSFMLRDGGDTFFYVPQWNDKSGQSNHVMQTTAAQQPRRIGNAVRSYTGGGIHMISTAQIPITNDQLTVFMVVRPTSLVSNGGYHNWLIINDGLGATSASFFQLYQVSASTALNLNIQNTNSDITNISSFFAAGAVTIVGAGKDGATTFLRKNGVQAAINITGTQVMTSRNLILFRILTNYSNGDLMEVLVFNTALSASETTSIETYLRQKWGNM